MQQNNFDQESRVFTHSSAALMNPKEPAKFMPQAFATIDSLPDLKTHEVAQRNIENTAWVVVKDYRGTVYNKQTKEKLEQQELGDLADHLTHLKPDQFDKWDEDSGAWKKDLSAELMHLKTLKENQIRREFKAAANAAVAANNEMWNGGQASAIAIDSAIRIAEQQRLTELSLFDANNDKHVVDIATAKSITAEIGMEYQKQFAKKQQLMKAIEIADKAQLEKINW